jgi:alkylation response protein AidB-like acyl-CoA dehydrogenase
MNLITPEQTEIQKTAKAFAAQHIIPKAAEYDKSGAFHAFLLEAAKPSKIFGMAIPKAYGGLEYSPLTQALRSPPAFSAWSRSCWPVPMRKKNNIMRLCSTAKSVPSA